MKKVDKSSSAGTTVESSTDARVEQVCQPIAKHSVVGGAVSLPKNTYLGKRRYNGLMIGGSPVYSGVAQIFLECKYPNRKDCHDTIALLPKGSNGNEIINAITDEQAGKVFSAMGWLVKGYNNKEYTRCPNCAKRLKVTVGV